MGCISERKKIGYTLLYEASVLKYNSDCIDRYSRRILETHLRQINDVLVLKFSVPVS